MTKMKKSRKCKDHLNDQDEKFKKMQRSLRHRIDILDHFAMIIVIYVPNNIYKA